MAHLRADLSEIVGVPWLPATLDNEHRGNGTRRGYEPTIAEFRAGIFGVEAGAE